MKEKIEEIREKLHQQLVYCTPRSAKIQKLTFKIDKYMIKHLVQRMK